MNLNMHRLAGISAFAAVLVMGAPLANAQGAAFHLPVEAHWGSAVLSPGDYTFSAPDSTSNLRVFYLRSSTGSKVMVPQIVNQDVSSGRSCLKLVKINGAYYVREYDSAVKGIAYDFAVPKSGHLQMDAANRMLVVPENK